MKQHTRLLMLLPLAVLLAATACKKEPVSEPPGGDSPQQQLPNPLPAHALVRQQRWTETDHQTFAYNDKGQVMQEIFQYQYVQGDPTKIRTMIYDFTYDSQNRPVQLNYTGGFTTQFLYHGNLIHKTRELYPGGALAKEVTYLYSNNRMAQETWRIPSIPGEPDDVYKHVFGYDNRGNLNKVEVFEQTGVDQFKLLETTTYSDFDDKINPLSWQLRYPYIPQLRLQFNNPRKVSVQAEDGTVSTTTYAYEYNAQGLPVSNQETRPNGGVLNSTYQY
ncbi:MAG: hypothetical protein KDD14_18695 [Saprospiraceae bacterium]|nr:hypothetical protein [Saprospiraceae bacterium]